MDKPFFEKLGAFVVNFRFLWMKHYRKYKNTIYSSILAVVVVCFGLYWVNTITVSDVYKAIEKNDVSKLCEIFNKTYEKRSEEREVFLATVEGLVKLNNSQADEFLGKFVLNGPNDVKRDVCNSYDKVKPNFISVMMEQIESMDIMDCHKIREKSLLLVNLAENAERKDELKDLPYILAKKITLNNAIENEVLFSAIRELSIRELVPDNLKRIVDEYFIYLDKMKNDNSRESYSRMELCIIANAKLVVESYYLKDEAIMKLCEKKLGNYLMKYPMIEMKNKIASEKINAELLKAVDGFELFLSNEYYGNVTVDRPELLSNNSRLLYQNEDIISLRFSGAYYRFGKKWCWVFDKNTGDVVPLKKFHELSLDTLKEYVRTGEAIVLDASFKPIPLSNDKDSDEKLNIEDIKRVSKNYFIIHDNIIVLEYNSNEFGRFCCGSPYIILGVKNYDARTRAYVDSIFWYRI